MGARRPEFSAVAANFPVAGSAARQAGPTKFRCPDSDHECGETWWAVTDSNRRHPACKAGALPTELTAHQTAQYRGTAARRKRCCRSPKRNGRRELIAPRPPYLPGGSGRNSSDRFFQLFRSAEGDLFARLDLNLLARRRIAADARCALADLKNAETADTDALAFLQMLDNIADEIPEHGLRLFLRHLVRFRECRGKMLERDGWRCRSFSRNHCHQWDPPLESALGETPNAPLE